MCVRFSKDNKKTCNINKTQHNNEIETKFKRIKLDYENLELEFVLFFREKDINSGASRQTFLFEKKLNINKNCFHLFDSCVLL